jgi:hypothetical protein
VWARGCSNPIEKGFFMRIAVKLSSVLLALAIAIALVACGGEDEEVTGQFEPVPGAPAGYADVSGEATLTRSDDGTEVSIRVDGLRPDADYVSHVHAGGCDQADPGGPHYKFDSSGSDEPPNEIHLSFTSNADGAGEAEASNSRRIPDGDAGSVVVHAAEEEMHEESSHGEAMKDDGHGGDAMSHGDGHSHSDKVACANLEGGSSTSGSSGGAGDAMKHEGDAMKHEGQGSSIETIVIRGGRPVGGVRELEYSSGDEIAFRVRSDVADEVHVHGYDLSKDVRAGGSVAFSFAADLEGIFEVELEERGEQIAELRVNP